MTKKPVNRRLFLQGFGGVAVAAPFLGTLFAKSAHGQSASAPLRVIVFFTHYGCITNRYFPAKSHGQLVAADYEAMPTLAPMAPYADKLLMVRGVRAMNEWSFEQTLGQETDPHSQVMNAYFTCCPSDGWSGLGANPPRGVNSATPKRKSNCLPIGGRSLDHIMAEQINNPRNPTPLYIGIGGGQNSANNTMTSLSFSTVGEYDHAQHKATVNATLYPSVGTPQTIYDNITNLFGGTGTPTMTDASYEVSKGKHILDLCRDDLSRLKAASMSTSDKQKLEAWEALLTDTGNMMGMGSTRVCSEDDANSLMLTSQAITGGASNDLSKAMPVMLSLATLSALCDDNRVIFMKTPGNKTYSHLSINKDHHNLSHRNDSANQGGGQCLAGVLDMLGTIDRYHAESFASLVKMLNDIPEGDGKMLDNSAAIWFQELSDGNSHNLNNMPILQAGSLGGYFKTGWAINVDGGAADMTPGTSEALCKDGGALGSSTAVLDSSGSPMDVANAPINKYYCTLMNALGMKADANGFPSKDGVEGTPITKFGYYDDTKDFITFLTDNPAPPMIKQPGEFEDLKA